MILVMKNTSCILVIGQITKLVLSLDLLEAQKDFNLIVVGGDTDEVNFYKNIKPSLREE